MGYLKEQVSYLRGLADGMCMDKTRNETKLFEGILMLLNDMADSIEASESDIEDMEDAINDIEEDLDGLESFVFDNDMDFSPCADDDEAGDFVELECPNCKDHIFFDSVMLESEKPLVCPSCSKPFPASAE